MSVLDAEEGVEFTVTFRLDEYGNEDIFSYCFKEGEILDFVKTDINYTLGLRIVYGIARQDNIMKIIVISVRDDDTVYKMAQGRVNNRPLTHPDSHRLFLT